MNVEPNTHHSKGILTLFAQHPVAANLLMALMFIAGFVGLSKLNAQFFPNFALDIVSVRVVWVGANPEDVESSLVNPLEEALKNVDQLKKMTSASVQGVASVTLEFDEGTDMILALDQVKQKVDEIRNLPQTAETPVVQLIPRYEGVAKILLASKNADLDELRRMANDIEKDLLSRGIDKVEVKGLPQPQIAIEVDPLTLQQQGLTLSELAQSVSSQSVDVPSGTLGESDVAREIRGLGQARTVEEFARIPVQSSSQDFLQLGDVAEVKYTALDNEAFMTYKGMPAIQLNVSRSESGDSLAAAKIIDQWRSESLPKLPASVEVVVFDEIWLLLEGRIMLLVNNGITGLIFVILILYLFMNGRVAFWVAVGIPTSFAATLAVMYLTGGSINMISLFALIMALGIIVDDAIVVGEDALAHFQYGEDPLLAAEGGAHRMFWPVVASSLTTIAAFLPLMMIGGIIGNILIAIPMVIIAVILASLIESFFILPGHLRHSFQSMDRKKTSALRQKMDSGFEHFRDEIFKPAVEWALAHRSITLASVITFMILAIGLLAGGRLNFVFFPSPEGKAVNLQVSFMSGTPREQISEFLDYADNQLYLTEQQLGGDLVNVSVVRHGLRANMGNQGGGSSSVVVGSIEVELKDPEQREITNDEFIDAWKQNIQLVSGIDNFFIGSRKGGPPGRDVAIKLIGSDTQQLKAASMDLQSYLSALEGVSDIEDDLPFGKDQFVFELTPFALANGVTVDSISRQLRGFFDGQLVQVFTDQGDEVEVRLSLKEAQKDQLATLNQLFIKLPSDEFVPLVNLVDWKTRQGFEVLRHYDGQLAVEVGASVDKVVNNASRITAEMEKTILPQLQSEYGVTYTFEGPMKDQRETMADMKLGLVIGLILIYVVLAWVFGSYGWPVVVMAVIPFGLVGAIFGHILMGLDLTILSMFGFFALSGIVVNDSIVLVTFYKSLREKGLEVQKALVEAACQRLRAVVLTSLTTIAGLTPLLFETSLQAQFLIPMAATIAFGLAFATVLILFVVPVLLSVYEQWFYKAKS